MKIAIVTDSNSGVTQAQAKELGITVIPMPFMINGETYEEDINLTQEQFYTDLTDGAEISTSQPSPQTVMNQWNELLDDDDDEEDSDSDDDDEEDIDDENNDKLDKIFKWIGAGIIALWV